MIIKTEIVQENNNYENSYGLIVETSENTLHFTGLTESKIAIQNLCKRIEGEDITNEHLKDIIKDFILGNAYDRLTANELH